VTPVIGRGVWVALVALLVMGCTAILVEVQSPSSIYWTGERISATSEGGIIYYRYGGRDYTINDEHRDARDVQRVPVAVFVDPDEPTTARADGPARWLDAALVSVWFVAAAVLVPFGVVRQRRRRRRQAEFAAAGTASSGQLRREQP
jgi:hypothetical protein